MTSRRFVAGTLFLPLLLLTARVQGQSAPPFERAVVPAGRGWFCAPGATAASRPALGGAVPELASCHRARAACRSVGRGECTRQAQAFCISYEIAAHSGTGGPGVACYPSAAVCATARPLLESAGNERYGYFNVSSCAALP